LATSVKTLTTGSQATVGLRRRGFPEADDGEARGGLAAAAGTRRRKVVSEKPSNFSETVCVDAGEPAGAKIRSAFEARLTDELLSLVEADIEDSP